MYFSGLTVSQNPPKEIIILEDCIPLILFFNVCGERQSFEGVGYKVRISQEGIGRVDTTPLPNAPLGLSASARTRGAAASFWDVPLPAGDYERCVEVAVRVWSNHTKVQNSTVQLILTTRESGQRFYGTSVFSLQSLPPSPTTTAAAAAAAATATATEEAEAAATATTIAEEKVLDKSYTPPTMSELRPCLCYC